jgi:hypothetical protein
MKLTVRLEIRIATTMLVGAALLVVGCLKEKADPADDSGLLPPDLAVPPGNNDGGLPTTSTAAQPLRPSEFVFRRGSRVLAYDLAANTERELFDARDVWAVKPSPDRKSFVGLEANVPSDRIAKILWLSLDGQPRVARAAKVNTDPRFFYYIFDPTWSSDGSNVFYFLQIEFFGPESTFTNTHPSYFNAASPTLGEISSCNVSPSSSPASNPIDPTRVLFFRTEYCQGLGPGLTEFSITPPNPFRATRRLVPSAEFGYNREFDWLHDGSGIVYTAKDGLVRLDLTTGARSVFYRFAASSRVYIDVGPGDEIIASIEAFPTQTVPHPPVDIYRVFPETGVATPLTTDGKSSSPSW